MRLVCGPHSQDVQRVMPLVRADGLLHWQEQSCVLYSGAAPSGPLMRHQRACAHSMRPSKCVVTAVFLAPHSHSLLNFGESH